MENYLIEFENDNVLEIGGGSKPLFHPNMDTRKLPEVDIAHNLNEIPWPIDSNSFDGALGIYVLEHISRRSIKQAVSEIYRILKQGGKFVALIPNTLEQCKIVAATNEWSDDFSCMLFGDQNYGENAHACGFSPNYVKKLFSEAGFERVNVISPMPNIIFRSVGLFPSCATDMVIEAFKPQKTADIQYPSQPGDDVSVPSSNGLVKIW